MHFEEPVEVATVPDEHEVHAVAPSFGLEVPAEQSPHADTPAVEYEPAPHKVQALTDI